MAWHKASPSVLVIYLEKGDSGPSHSIRGKCGQNEFSVWTMGSREVATEILLINRLQHMQPLPASMGLLKPFGTILSGALLETPRFALEREASGRADWGCRKMGCLSNTWGQASGDGGGKKEGLGPTWF